jgi:uncharacterized RDD family membrane protein YckC
MDTLEHRDEPVLGLDNIALELPLAGLGSRLLAAMVDYSVLALVALVYAVVGGMGMAALPGMSTGLKVGLFILGFFLLHWGYFIVFEIATAGRTPGKRAVRLRVVGREGGTPSAMAFVVRNLLRAFDILVGVLLVALDAQGRRLGDRLAGTLVVHERPQGQELSLGRIPPGWGAKEVAVVEAFLARAELGAEPTLRLGARLIALVERDAPRFLDGIDRSAHPRQVLTQALEVSSK